MNLDNQFAIYDLFIKEGDISNARKIAKKVIQEDAKRIKSIQNTEINKNNYHSVSSELSNLHWVYKK